MMRSLTAALFTGLLVISSTPAKGNSSMDWGMMELRCMSLPRGGEECLTQGALRLLKNKVVELENKVLKLEQQVQILSN